MDTIDISTMGTPDLRRLQVKVDIELKRRAENAKKTALKRMRKVAEEEGVSFQELINEASVPASVASIEPKKRGRKAGTAKTKPKERSRLPLRYFNPENPAKGWAGHGRKPQWVIDWLAAGKSLSELERP